MEVKVAAPTNIAVVKYWGKQPELEEMHVPTKSSLSFTVEGLRAETKLRVEEGRGLSLELNGVVFEEGDREYEYIKRFFEKAATIYPFISEYAFSVSSKTNFPVAAGFASSAAGFAALAKAIAEAFPERIKTEREVSVLARLGSGSAARSVPSAGGVVLWHRGDLKDHTTSYAESLFPPEHWDDLRIIYVMLEGKEKKVKSRAGMKESVRTNPLYWQWVEHEEKEVLPKIVSYIKDRNFHSMAEEIMKCSNNLHMVCLGTYPPIMYLSQKSFEIIEEVHAMNSSGNIAAYTFDAGPNPIIITREKDLNEVKSRLSAYADLIVVKQGKGATRL